MEVLLSHRGAETMPIDFHLRISSSSGMNVLIVSEGMFSSSTYHSVSGYSGSS